MTKVLGDTISLFEIKEQVRKLANTVFKANSTQLKLENYQSEDFKNIKLPPINDRSSLLKLLFNAKPDNDEAKWDYIVMLTYFNNGEINYNKIEEDIYEVNITF